MTAKLSQLAWVAIIVELVGIAAVGAGIGVELSYEAHLGFVLISIGSILVAGGGLIWAKIVGK